MPQSPLFEGLSLEQPSLLTITFPKHDVNVSLGATLANHDNGLTNEMMAPGFASIGALLEEDHHQPSSSSSSSLARKYGVKVGDYIVGINGVGYRRFPPDFPYETLEDVTLLPPPLAIDDEEDLINLNANTTTTTDDDDDNCAKNEENDEGDGEDSNDKDDDTYIQAKTTTTTATTTTTTCQDEWDRHNVCSVHSAAED